MKGDRIRYKAGYKYQLAEDYSLNVGILGLSSIEIDYIILDAAGILTIKKGYAWDGASGPTIDTKSSMRGALVHDALYQLMRLGLLDESFRDHADTLFRDICIEDGMWSWRAKLWGMAVAKCAGPSAKKGTEREVLEAP